MTSRVSRSNDSISRWISIPFVIALLVTLFWIFTTVRSDFKVAFTRSVPSKESETNLTRALFDLSDWPVFVRVLKHASLENSSGEPLASTAFHPGAVLRLDIAPPGKEWKKFTVKLRILEVAPDKGCRLQFVSDSSGKMNDLFSDLEWSLQIEPATITQKQSGNQARVSGSLQGVTLSKRSRFFGTLSTRILLNQIFFFDLIKLSSVSLQKELKSQNLAPAYP